MANTAHNSGIPRKKPTRMIANEPAFTEDVRSRAYSLYESRGREDGHGLYDWLLAEQQGIRYAARMKRLQPARSD